MKKVNHWPCIKSASISITYLNVTNNNDQKDKDVAAVRTMESLSVSHCNNNTIQNIP